VQRLWSGHLFELLFWVVVFYLTTEINNMTTEELILEAFESNPKQLPQGQEIWKIAARSNEKPGRFTKKQVKLYKRVGLL
jgi:hypothetical protein